MNPCAAATIQEEYEDCDDGNPLCDLDCTDQDTDVGFHVMDGFFHTHVMSLAHEIGETDGDCGETHQAMQDSHEFRHLCHLDTPGSSGA